MQYYSRDRTNNPFKSHVHHHRALQKYIAFVNRYDIIGAILLILYFTVTIFAYNAAIAFGGLILLFFVLYGLGNYMLKRFLKLLIRDNKEFSSINFSKTNLKNFDLSGRMFIGTNFEKANLVGVNFKKSFLAESNMAYANLEGANLQEANLTNTLFIGTNLTKSNLEGTALTGALFFGANLTNCNIALPADYVKALERTTLGYNLRSLEDFPRDLLFQMVSHIDKIEPHLDLPVNILAYMHSSALTTTKVNNLLALYKTPVLELADKYVKDKEKFTILEYDRLKHEINSGTIVYLEQNLPWKDQTLQEIEREKIYQMKEEFQLLM